MSENEKPETTEDEAVEDEPVPVTKASTDDLKKDANDLFDRAVTAGTAGFKALGSTFLRRTAKAISEAVDDFTGKWSKD